DENLEISSGSNNTIKASSVGGDIRFLGLKQDLTLDRIDLNLDKDGKPVETTSINNNAGMFVYSDYSSNYINSLNIGDIKDDAIFKLIVKPSKGDSYDGLILKKGTSFKADVSHSNKMTLISDDDAPFNIIGECKAGNFSICGSAYNDYFKLDNDGNADYVTVLGGDGSDVFDFTNTINKQNVIIPNFGFETTSDGSFSPSNNADVFVIKSFDPSELAVFRFTSVELIYYNTHIRMGNSSDQYYIHLATPDNTADTRCYQVTSSGLVYVGENQGSLIAATGWTPQTITAVGGRDTLDGGTNAGVNDTLVSAGKYRNTTFALHKGGGDNIIQYFDFGAEKDRNDVVAVDTAYSTYKLITPENGKVTIGSKSEGSLTMEGNCAQNEFIYDYGGNIGIVSVDMSSDSKYMKFVKEANFHIGQGEKTTLVFTSADSIESGVAGNQKGLGWATPYISEGLGTIDASAGHVGAVLGSNDLDQTIIVSKSKDFDEVWGGGGLDVGFSNGTNDTIVGSGNGNTVYYVGHKMG
ncbi:MAG: hypothetical protein IKN43_08140, partial [Selenomonadaceae bacterium]|nr:hypothetical protein [Selenomonadaceae bacterium]